MQLQHEIPPMLREEMCNEWKVCGENDKNARLYNEKHEIFLLVVH